MTVMSSPSLPNTYDVHAIRQDFPIFEETVYGKPLVFLDSGASAQKPRQVIDAMTHIIEHEYANVHRGVYYLSQKATDAFENAREAARAFINAGNVDDIIFTKNATEAFNLIAHSLGSTFQEGDEVIVSAMEHHANIVPWQLLRQCKGIVLKVAPIADDGSFLLEEFEALVSPKTRLVSITHASNVLGTVTPAKEIARIAHDHGAYVMFDGSQAAVHMPVDVQDIDADFYAFTGHKLYGPTGIGVLYGKKAIMDGLPPFLGGGDMIESVSFEKTTFKQSPHRFEAGTPAIIESVGLHAAFTYVDSIGREAINAHEHALLEHATETLGAIPGLTIYGNAPGKAAIVSFDVEGVHPHDLGTIVDREGVAVRVGQHCAEPLMNRLGIFALTRASFGLYNTHDDVEALAKAVRTAQEFFA